MGQHPFSHGWTFCILSTDMTSLLLQLTAAPNLVEQVFSRLIGAISEGALPPVSIWPSSLSDLAL
jgi:hypothetical protein